MGVSVVVPVRDEQGTVAALLEALKGRPRGEKAEALDGKEYAELVAELAQKEKA